MMTRPSGSGESPEESESAFKRVGPSLPHRRVFETYPKVLEGREAGLGVSSPYGEW